METPVADRKPLFLDINLGYPTEVSSGDNLRVGKLTTSGVSGVGLDMSGQTIVNLGMPQQASDAATKGYIDNVAQGITQIPSVRALANSNQALTGLPSVDGVTLVAGDRLLLVAQSNAVQNGVWTVASGAWARPTGAGGVSDWVTGRNVSGFAMFVREGNSFADQGWVAITDGAPKVDTDPVLFTQYTGLGEVVTGDGLVKQASSGNQIAIRLAAASGLQFTSGALDSLLDPTGALAKSAAGVAVKPNANNTVAVDAQGLRTLGVPGLFTVAGSPVSSNVTAANLSTLSDGAASLADGLHQHQNVLEAQSNVSTFKNGATALSAGDAVQWSSTPDTLARCDAASINTSQCIGVALAATPANANGRIVKRGIAAGVLSQATPGSAIYVGVGGGLTSSIPTASGAAVVRVGVAKSGSDLDVNPVFVGQRSAS